MGIVGPLPLEDLTDVEIAQPPRNGQTLVFDETEGVWRNRAGGTGGGTGGGTEYLSGLSDVQTTRATLDVPDWLMDPRTQVYFLL